MNRIEIAHYIENVLHILMGYLPKLFWSIVILALGLFLIQKLLKLADIFFNSQHFDPSLKTFFHSSISIGLKVILFVVVAGKLGLQTTSFVAIIGAVSIGVGLALQGSLSNFAGGVLILLLRPFKVGDWVTVLNEHGKVEQIQIFHTIILTIDNRTAILPNGAIMNNSIVNFSHHGILLVDLKIRIDFKENLERVRTILIEAIKTNDMVLLQPPPSVNILNLDGGNILLAVRSYVNWENYWEVYFKNFQLIQEALIKNGVQMPREERYNYLIETPENNITLPKS